MICYIHIVVGESNFCILLLIYCIEKIKQLITIAIAALVIPWRQVLALVVQATIVNNRLIYITKTTTYIQHNGIVSSSNNIWK